MGISLSVFRGFMNNKLLDAIQGVDDENKKLLEGVDNYTLAILASLPLKVLAAKPVTHEFVKTEEIDLGWEKTSEDGGFDDWKKSEKPLERTDLQFSPNLKIPMNTEDDNFGVFDNPALEKLRNGLLFPLKDKIVKVDDETALGLAKQLYLSPRETEARQASPTPYHDWTEMSSDEAMSRIFFYGIGSVLMAAMKPGAADEYNKEEVGLGPYVVDLPLSELEVRRGFQPYGFRIHFDAEQKVTAIYDYVAKKLVKPGDGQAWERAKFITRITTFTVITAREHLLWNHMILSNAMTRATNEKLPPSHPVRRLLTVFTFRTNAVNNGANVLLVPNLSLVHRAVAFTRKGLEAVFETGYKASNIFEPFSKRVVTDDLKALSDDGKFPYMSEGIAFYNIVETFVKDWLSNAEGVDNDDATKEFYKEIVVSSKGQSYEVPEELTMDNLVDVLTQLIFCVTAYHEMVGTVVDYTEKPSFMGFRALADEDSLTVDLQSYMLSAALTASTSLRMPALIASFDNFFGAGGAPEWERTCWDTFQSNLGEQSNAVKEADATREIEFKTFDPARLESAVSV